MMLFTISAADTPHEIVGLQTFNENVWGTDEGDAVRRYHRARPNRYIRQITPWVDDGIIRNTIYAGWTTDRDHMGLYVTGGEMSIIRNDNRIMILECEINQISVQKRQTDMENRKPFPFSVDIPYVPTSFLFTPKVGIPTGDWNLSVSDTAVSFCFPDEISLLKYQLEK